MGKIRYRKTKKFGPVNVTFSNRGIGTSIGVKGARIGRGADGKTRLTTSIPGTGFSQQTVLGGRSNRNRSGGEAGAGGPRQGKWFAPLLWNLFLPGTALFFLKLPIAAILWLLLAFIGSGIKQDFLIGLAWIGSYVHYFLAKSGNMPSFGKVAQSTSEPVDLGPTPEQLQELEDIRGGQLPVMESGMILDSGEVCHLAQPAIYLREGDESSKKLNGTLVVTNTQVIFSSSLGGWSIKHSNILQIKDDEHNFQIYTSLKRGNGLFFTSEHHRAAAILETTVKLYKRLMLMPEDGEQTRRIPQEVKVAVWQRDQGKCVQCGATDYLEFDHIIPFSKGGANTEGNVQLLCRRCNLAKSDRI